MESPTSANAPASGTRLPPYRYSRFWFSLAVNIFLLSTLLALLQPRDPDGEFSWLRPYEPAAQKALPLIKADLNAVFIESPNAIWFGGNNGVVVVTADDGKTFKRLPADTAGDVTLGPLTLTSVTDTASTSTSVTDTASDTASISTSVTDTSDTASTRTSIPGPAFDTAGTDTASTRFDPPDHTAPDFFAGDVVALRVSGRRAVAVMRDGFEYYSLDRGARWRFDDQRRTLGDALLANGSWLRSISFYADTPVDALDAHGRLSGRSLGDYATLPTSDVIARWTDQGAGLDATARRGEITLNALRRPTRTWRIDRTIHPNALFFTRNNGGWLVGDGGVMLRLDPATNRWLRVASKTTADLHGVAFTPDGQRGWAAGARGAVLQSVDGGVTWRRRTREWTGGPQDDGSSGASWPGVWWLLANAFLTLPFLGVAARALPQPKDEQGEASVADVPSSDRPLQAGDPDPLNMRAIALAISRFLRNDKTQPPLTIAITGEWGSGKSSLMNLLRADLVRFGFRPVWFNAWHHQKEEHLLASLLQSVRLQAVPSWWTAENLFFRARLIWIRGVKHRAGLLLLLFLFGVAIAYEQRHDHGPFSFFTDAVATSVDRPLPDLVKSLPSDFLQRFELVPLLFLISVCVTAWKGLHAFGVEPGKLLATISGSARVRDLNAQISFRQTFASEFRDVTKALGPRTMLVFVDDLDRCKPETVPEVLEAINFLVTSGDCFVVMGIDRTRVERYLKTAYGRAAEGEPDFAGNYLDKLINIEVPVPTPTDAETARILTAAVADRPKLTFLQQTRAAATYAPRFLPTVLAAIALWAGLQTSRLLPDPAYDLAAPETTSTVASSSAVSTAGATLVTTTNSTAAPAPPNDAVPAHPFQTGEIVPGVEPSRWPRALPALILLVPLVLVAWWLMARPAESIPHDSNDFKRAVAIWQPMIVARNRTPRSLKRFMNRVRFLAMRQRPIVEATTMWTALADRIAGRQAEEPAPLPPRIPEAELVALSAIYSFRKEWLLNDTAPTTGDADERAFVKLAAEHAQAFGPFDVSTHRQRFLELASVVRVNA